MADFRTATRALLIAVPIAISCGASAETEPADDQSKVTNEAAAEDLGDIEDLVITARRRPELLQEIPVAATVLGGELLEQRGIDSLEDIGLYVPNLTTFSGAQRQGSFYSRGVGQRDAFVTLDPGVGIYVDDVYIARGQGALLAHARSRAHRGAARPAGHALRKEYDRRRDQARFAEAGAGPLRGRFARRRRVRDDQRQRDTERCR